MKKKDEYTTGIIDFQLAVIALAVGTFGTALWGYWLL